jgi:hypothetical protein
MTRRAKRRPRLKDDVVGWVGVLITIVALYVIDNPSEPHKWHPAIVWSCTAFSTIALFGRTQWQSWRFWALFMVFLLLHVFAMWWVFDKIVPAGHVWGTLFVVPIAFVEGILVLGQIVRFENMLDPRFRV